MIAFNPTELARSICRDSLFDTVRELWHVVIAEKPVWNWHIEFLCDEIQQVLERVFDGKPKEYDLLINIPPGTTKSTICSVFAPAWAMGRMPTFRTIVATHAFDLGLDLSLKCRDVVESDRFQEIFDGVSLRHDLNTKSHFKTTAGGERYVATVSGRNPMGKHAHALIVDDPIDPEKAFSEPEMEAANRFLTNTLPSRMIDKNIVPIILVMQRLHQNDPSANMIKTTDPDRLRHIQLPAEVDKNDVKPARCAKKYVDGLLDPVRLTRKTLKAIELQSQYTKTSQYDLRPTPPGGGMFKTGRIKIEPQAPRMVKIVRFWDKAASEKKTACYTAGGKLGLDATGRFWILHMERFKLESYERDQKILQTAQIDGTGVRVGLEEEGGSGGKDSARATIKLLAGFRVVAVKPSVDKVIRADPFASQVGGDNVSMVAGPWNHELLEELQFFPFSTYKDQVDALSGAFNLLTAPVKKATAIGR